MIIPYVRLLVSTVCLCFAGASLSAATLHGRVKDPQCQVLSQATVRIHSAKPGIDRTLTTDDSGNYTVDLPLGDYQVCIERGARTVSTCTDVTISAKGDAWITTQMRNAPPDLSNIGNRSY